MLYPDPLQERLIADYGMVLEIVCEGQMCCCDLCSRLCRASKVARKRRRQPASAAELAPHIFDAARSSSDELPYGGRLVLSCLVVSHCRLLPFLSSFTNTPILFELSLPQQRLHKYPRPRTTPITRPLSAGASPSSPTFGYSYRQPPSHTQYTPYSRSLASPPLHMA